MAGGTIQAMARALGLTSQGGAGQYRRDGDRARDLGNWAEAMRCYRGYLEAEPTAFPIWVQLGHVSKETGDLVAAEQAYQRALALQPDNADLLLNIGHLMKRLGRVDEARDHYLRSVERDPTSDAASELARLGTIAADAPAAVSSAERHAGDRARDRADWTGALTQYRAHLDQHPGDFAIRVQLGHVAKEAGDAGAAEDAYRAALDLRPQDADLLLNLGHLMRGLERLDEARDFYTRSADLDPSGVARRELRTVERGSDLGSSSTAPAAVAREAPSPFLSGGLAFAEARREPVAVVLMEGGQEVARAMTEGVGLHQSFRFRLPPEVCDGRPHGFIVVAEGEEVARIATITPAHLTPASVLADYATGEMRGRMSTVAGWRYAALAERMGTIADAGEAATVAAIHRLLVDGARATGEGAIYPPIAFAAVEAPVATIVIPVHGKFDFTYRCLASLWLMPNRTAFEIVVVDDGSTDRTTALADVVGGIRIVRHDSAQGFVRACNAGAAEARGDTIVLLNNDTEVSPHWLDRLLEPFSLYADVGLVGAKLIFADGRLQEAGGVVFADGRAANYGRLGSPRDPRYNFLRETDYCSAACVAIPRGLWEELGGFDLRYVPAYYEDTDLAFRVRERGRKVVFQPLAEILHFEGVSNGTDTKSGLKRYQVVNESTFLERWGGTLVNNGSSRDRDAMAIERSYPRRVLVIDNEVPQPDRSAGHHAAVQEMRLLQSLGYRVTFLPRNLAYLGRYNDLLAQLGIEVAQAPFWLSMEEFITARAREFDLVYVTRYTIAQDVLPLVRQHIPEAKVVFNNADLHFLRAIRDAMASDDQAARDEAESIREAELAIILQADLTLSYSDVEHAVIESHTLGRARVALCPWVVEPRPRGPAREERADIAFLGGYRHPPNIRAVEFFANEVMPLLRQRRPGIRFRVYGSHPPASFAALASEDVIIEGFVDRVEDALDRARLFVAPLLTGAGLKGKVIEALASGIPSVLSPVAAEGTGLRDGMEVAIAGTPAEWAERIATLYDDADAWNAMADASVDFVARRFSFEAARETLKRGFNANGIPTLTGPVSRYLPRP